MYLSSLLRSGITVDPDLGSCREMCAEQAVNILENMQPDMPQSFYLSLAVKQAAISCYLKGGGEKWQDIVGFSPEDRKVTGCPVFGLLCFSDPTNRQLQLPGLIKTKAICTMIPIENSLWELISQKISMSDSVWLDAHAESSLRERSTFSPRSCNALRLISH